MKFKIFKAEFDPSIENLSAEGLQKFKGGILEIINQVEGYIYRGEIKDLCLKSQFRDDNTIDNISLCLNFVWVKKTSYNCVPTDKWEDQERLDYETTLICAFAQTDELGRLMITNPATDEMLLFFNPEILFSNSGMETEKLFLTQSWRMLLSELDVLLQLKDFNETYKGAAPRLSKCLDAMQVIAKHATVPLNEEVQAVEANLLK